MINTARTLIGSLTDEQTRWRAGAKEIGDEKRRLIGNCSLATAFISYSGPFDATFRHML
jgi:dynein heavy chain